MKLTSWTDKDLIEYEVKRSYSGYRICKTFYTVLTALEEEKPTFYSLTFLQKEDSMKAIFTRRDWDKGWCGHKVVKELTFETKEEGNEFFLKVLASKKVSKSKTIFYRA